MIKTYLIFFAILFTACNVQKTDGSVLCLDNTTIHSVPRLSFKDLYTSKEVDGKTVSLAGFFSYNFEDIALYPNRSNLDQKGVWLVFDDKLLQNDSLLTKLNGKMVTVIGVIDLSKKGHLSSYFCTLFDIICIRERQ